MPSFPLPGPPYPGIAINGGQNPAGSDPVVMSVNAGGVPVLLNLLVVFTNSSTAPTGPSAFTWQTSKLSSGQWAHWYWAVYDTLAEIGDGPSNEMTLPDGSAFHTFGIHVCSLPGGVFDGAVLFASFNSNAADPVDQDFVYPFSALTWIANTANVVHVWSTGALPSIDNFQILQSVNYSLSGFDRSTWLIGPPGIDSRYVCAGERSRSIFSVADCCSSRRNYIGVTHVGN